MKDLSLSFGHSGLNDGLSAVLPPGTAPAARPYNIPMTTTNKQYTLSDEDRAQLVFTGDAGQMKPATLFGFAPDSMSLDNSRRGGASITFPKRGADGIARAAAFSSH